MPQKCIFKDFCRWHTKRGIDGQAPANPNFGITTTEILNDIVAARNSLDTNRRTARGTLHLHFSLCSVVAVYTAQSMQPMCSVDCLYTAATLHVHSTSVWEDLCHDNTKRKLGWSRARSAFFWYK